MTLNLRDIREYVEGGWIREQVHPDFPELSIFNYTQVTQYEQKWNDITKSCRGLIMNTDTGEIIARPFKKFFNLAEHKPEEIPTSKEYVIREKLDGSLGIHYEYGGKQWIATRGSFTSEQASWATDWYRQKYDKYLILPSGLGTDLFEIIYPENRIVVDYGDMKGLVYLDTIDKETGKVRGQLLGYQPVAKTFYFEQFDNLPVLEGEEGYVIYWPKEDFMIKVKFDEYVKLHRIRTMYSKRRLWEHIKEGNTIAEFLEGLAVDEFYKQVELDAEDLLNQYEHILNQAGDMYREVKDIETRKEQALHIKDFPYKSVVFKMLDDQPHESLVWGMVDYD